MREAKGDWDKGKCLAEARHFQEREKFGLKMFEGVLGSVWELPSVSYEIYQLLVDTVTV